MDARKDSGGWKRGQKGIDGSKGVGFQTKDIDRSAEKSMYGQGKDISPKTEGE